MQSGTCGTYAALEVSCFISWVHWLQALDGVPFLDFFPSLTWSILFTIKLLIMNFYTHPFDFFFFSRRCTCWPERCFEKRRAWSICQESAGTQRASPHRHNFQVKCTINFRKFSEYQIKHTRIKILQFLLRLLENPLRGFFCFWTFIFFLCVCVRQYFILHFLLFKRRVLLSGPFLSHYQHYWSISIQ